MKNNLLLKHYLGMGKKIGEPSDGWIYLKKNFQATEKFEESILQDGISEFEISFKNVVYSGGNQCLLSIGENIKEWKPKEAGKYNFHIYIISSDIIRIQIPGGKEVSQEDTSSINLKDTHIINFDGNKISLDGVEFVLSKPYYFNQWVEYMKTAKNLKIGSMEGTPKPNVFFNYIKYK